MMTSARSASSHRTLPLEHPNCLAPRATSKISHLSLPDGITSHHITHRIRRWLVPTSQHSIERERERPSPVCFTQWYCTYVMVFLGQVEEGAPHHITAKHSTAQHIHTRDTEEHMMYVRVHYREATNERTSIASSVDRDIPSGERIELN
mmetsp:Transcript_9344/g.9110  ORF Transcript_9344/g.9110 Transcript_9344/m.9110 type:complete len:149 (-) Transcript_9344:74-520(-)